MPPFRNILIAADFSESSQEAFRVARALASEPTARLFVLHVVEPPLVFSEFGFPTPSTAEDQAHHQTLGERLRAVYIPDCPLKVEYLTREGIAAKEIVRVAQELGCDLIVLGTHGRTGLRRVLMGSVAETVLRRADCPVLTIKASIPVAAEPAAAAQKSVLVF